MSTDSASVNLPYTLKKSQKHKCLAFAGLVLLFILDLIIYFSSNKTRVLGVEPVTFLAVLYTVYVADKLSIKIVLDEDCIRYVASFDEEMQISYENIKQIRIQQIAMYSGMYFRIELFDYPHKIQLKKNSKFINIFFIGKDEWRKFLKVVVEKNPKVLLDYSSKLMLEGKY